MGIAFSSCGYCYDSYDTCRCTDETRRKADEYAAKMRPIREAEWKAKWASGYKGCSTSLESFKYIIKKLYSE
jgi:hypothetical protein